MNSYGFIDSSMIDEFFADVDKLSEQVADGMTKIKDGLIDDGIDQMMRPLHTIKGTTAFFGQSGYEEFSHIATLTHSTEDLLKDLQNGTIPYSASLAELMETASNTVFASMDAIRQGEPLLPEVMNALAQRLNTARKGEKSAISVETVHGVHVVRIGFKRMHLPDQYNSFVSVVDSLPRGVPVAVDLSGVLTLSSSAWGKFVELSARHAISAFAMTDSARHIYVLSGFDQHFPVYDDESVFWASRNDLPSGGNT